MLKNRSPLLSALLMLIFCASVLVGATYAQFTDNITVSGNVIQAANLKAELSYWASNTEGSYGWKDATKGAIFNYALWEPGYSDAKFVKVRNGGKLAFQYMFNFEPTESTQSMAQTGSETETEPGAQAETPTANLMDVIDVYYGVVTNDVTPPTQKLGRTEFAQWAHDVAGMEMKRIGTMSELNQMSGDTWGVVLPENGSQNVTNPAADVPSYEEEVQVCIVLHMQELAGNEYMGLPANSFKLKLTATQYAYENDAFGSDYDDIEFRPKITANASGRISVAGLVGDDGRLTQNVVITAADNPGVTVTVPQGTLLESGVTELVLTITPMAQTGSNVQLGENEEMGSIDVHVSGVSPQNTVLLQVSIDELLPVALNIGNYRLYHVENGETIPMTLLTGAEAVHNNFSYDPADGDVTMYMATFSEVALVADMVAAWEGKFDYSWYTNAVMPLDGESTADYIIANADQLAAFGAIVGGMNGQTQDSFAGKTVKLIADINLGDKESENNPDLIFYPIGYYNSNKNYEKEAGGSVTSSVSSFEGTFDGQGHTIKNFYQNTWEMFGDYNDGYSGTPNHYKDAMGLFGYVNGGTVKNLTVSNFSSDGEFTPTGVIAAYADGDATFENIAITNCNPRVYNTGNGGIVGIGGNSDDPDTYNLTFNNITIDKTNKITALWGSWDVGCGGVMGMYRGKSKVLLNNCHVSAELDVYNDVCANYQYYWYRYCGMLIGTVNDHKTENGYKVPNLANITAKDCTVTYGDWADYVYCEFTENTQASYTEDYQFSRVAKEDLSTNADGAIICTHDHKEVEDKRAVLLPFNQLFTGYGWGVKSVAQFDGVTVKKENADGAIVKAQKKFEYIGPAKLYADKEIYISSLFKKLDGVNISSASVYVGMTDLDKADGIVTAEYKVKNEMGWGENTIKFTGNGRVRLIIQDYYYCEPLTVEVEIIERQAEEKFEKLFDKDFLYRVGNANEVKLSSLFAAKEGAEIGTVSVTIEAVNGTAASGTCTTSGIWSNRTIDFNGTGVVKVTIKDDDQYCKPTELLLEVVDATNTTSAANATSKNIVLLNDAPFSSLEVSGGYTLYGNGFKAICSGNGSYRSAAVSYGFVTVENGGILDNVQVICDIFPESYLYTYEMTAGPDGRYPYGYSAVVISGNSTISNSYIYGARNNIQIGEGNVTIENTVTECGSLSNIHIKSSSGNTVTLDNVTTIQYQTTSKYDDSKTVLGFGILVGTNESASNPTIKLTGDLKQYNWVTSDDTGVSNKYAKAAISNALQETEYQHTIDGKTTVNTGIACLNTLSLEIIDEERSNKTTVPYVLETISMEGYKGQVYSVKKGSGVTIDNLYSPVTDKVIPYSPIKNRPIRPSVEYATGTGITLKNGYDTNKGWLSNLSVDLDNITGGSYDFKFSDLSVEKYGKPLEFTIKDTTDGNTVDMNTTITLNQLFTGEYTLVVTDDQLYNATGNLIGNELTHNMPFILNATKTSIDPPKFTNAGTATAIRLVSSKGGDWRPAYTALIGVSVTYWSASESKVKTVDLSTLYNSGTISSNVWTYTCDDYTLTITGGQVHSDESKITPVVANNTLYFASTNKEFTTGTTSRNIILDYVFTDKNASKTWNRTETVTYSELAEYDYNSFKNNGTLAEPSSSSSGTCLAEGTMITLADGSKCAVEDLRKGDMVMSYDHVTGQLTSKPVIIVVRTGSEFYENTFVFDDGSKLATINEHGIFDLNLNRYVNIDHLNDQDYIGHDFVAVDPNGNISTKKLIAVESEFISGYKYDIVTDGTLNYVAEDTLSVTHVLVDIINTFDFDENMRYDPAKMEEDIQKYGLYTYDEWQEYADISVFEEYNIPVMKVGISKGLYTKEYIIGLINTFVLDESVQIID